MPLSHSRTERSFRPCEPAPASEPALAASAALVVGPCAASASNRPSRCPMYASPTVKAPPTSSATRSTSVRVSAGLLAGVAAMPKAYIQILTQLQTRPYLDHALGGP